MNEKSRSLAARQAGASSLTIIVFFPIVLAVSYAAYHIMPFYYNYYELQNQMRSLIKVASMHTNEQLRKKLADHLKRMDMPFDANDVAFERFGNSMKMSIIYDETFWIPWQGEEYEVHTFNFDATVEEEF